jgi:hypothetical protein
VAVEESEGSQQADVRDMKSQIDDMVSQIEGEFTDPRDESRVHQATSFLKTAQMAIQHLYDAKRNRVDLVKAHEEEAKHNGHYAMERQNFPQMYANHYPEGS